MVASHWNELGAVNGYMPKFWGTFLVPLIMVALSIIFYVIPKIEPNKKNMESFREQYNLMWVGVLIFLLYIYLLTIVWNLGYRFNFTLILIPALAALYYLIGTILEKTKRNYFFGIRTPWTLDSDTVWKKTHILGGKLFKISAVISLVGLLVPNRFSFLWVLIPVITASIVVTVYSYLVAKK